MPSKYSFSESTNADRKQFKIAFSVENYHFRLPVCQLKRCFNAYRSAILDSRDNSRLPPIRRDTKHFGGKTSHKEA